jgi:hypothetical protein
MDGQTHPFDGDESREDRRQVGRCQAHNQKSLEVQKDAHQMLGRTRTTNVAVDIATERLNASLKSV